MDKQQSFNAIDLVAWTSVGGLVVAAVAKALRGDYTLLLIVAFGIAVYSISQNRRLTP